MTLGITITNLTLRYGAVTAIDGLSATLGGGKIYGLLGRNGSGKSSLLSVLAAFRKPTAGEIRIDGEPVWENPRITHQLSLIRESGDILDGSEKVAETLSYAAELRPAWDASFATRLLQRFDLPADQKVCNLSRGKRSALGVVLGLAGRAPVTMFDETYLGMDAPSRYAFYDELLSDFIANPRTIIISTHLIEEVASLFEEVLILDQGRLLLHEDAETLRSRGASVTGPIEAVDRFVDGHKILSAKQLGPTKSAMIYGQINAAHRQQGHAAGLEIGPVALQDLFVHLTDPPGASS